jgi:hypothetical protein
MSQSQLTTYIRAQARWRHDRAEEYPDDERNLRSARALDELADLVESGEILEGAEDVEPFALEILEEQLDAGTDVGVPGEQVSREVSRWGFDHPVDYHHQHVEFLNGLSRLALAESYDRVSEGVYTPETDVDVITRQAGLNRWEVEAALDSADLDDEYWRRRPHWTEQEQRDAIATYRQVG